MGIFSNDEEPIWSDVFALQDKLKRLQEENKRLQMLSCANCGEKYLSPDGSELYEKNVQLQKENEELKEMPSKEPKAMQAFQTAYSGLKKDNEVLWGMVKDYKTALEEIKEIAKEATNSNDCYIYMYAGRMYCEPILKKIDEVLDD